MIAQSSLVLILALLLPIMQTSPPVPRQATNHAARTGKYVQQQPNPEKRNATQSASNGNTEKNPDHEVTANRQRDENAQHSVVVSQLPPVTVNGPKRDWADWGTWLFNLLLLVVGAFQVVLLCWTLRFVKRQAQEMTRQRILMRHSVGKMEEGNRINREALQAVQRAYISFPMLDVQVLAVTDATGKIANWQFRTAIENTGNTPAVKMADHVNFHWIAGQQELADDFSFPDYGESVVYASTLAVS